MILFFKKNIPKLKLWYNIARTFGFRYVVFRSGYELERKLGIPLTTYPKELLPKRSISLAQWNKERPSFFFKSREDVHGKILLSETLEKEINYIFKGKIRFFNAVIFDLGLSYDWVTNPVNGFKYDIKKHWSEIEDLDESTGDIKYVWEKSRFCYVYTVIRYDQATGKDNSKFVFNEIRSWIVANPLNHGPNYLSSQEICLRILNWTFALYYYQESPHLTEELFNLIINSIYGQLRHVYSNIHFSRLAVRNNHAITETLTLYLAGVLFPFFPESALWKDKGKKWFEQEIAYQIYPDGTYVQFSMNYHRVVVQLLTWAFILAEKNGDQFSETTYERGRKTLEFLYRTQERSTGFLPNYGANDGSLFFPLNDCVFRDYRPQLSALAAALKKGPLYEEGPWDEDTVWYCGGNKRLNQRYKPEELSLSRFDVGGYYVMRDENSMTFIRCGNHKDRPSQADNLHLDIWWNGENILRDPGSFMYNTTQELARYFSGTASHNTVMLGNFDQMQKGPRFIWLGWTQSLRADLSEKDDMYEFEGKISAFHHLAKQIVHHRVVRKWKSRYQWEIIDTVQQTTSEPMVQIWNISDDFKRNFAIKGYDQMEMEIMPEIKTAWYSNSYGIKIPSKQIIFKTNLKYIKTRISILNS